MVLPQPENVIVPGGEVADVEGDVEVHGRMRLALREEPIGDAALIETSMVRACSPPAREPARSWLLRRSTMATSIPASANSPASISPVGPPPAITTAWLVPAVPFARALVDINALIS